MESKMKIKIQKKALKVPYMVVEYYREFKICGHKRRILLNVHYETISCQA
jgi:hypothetical protein